jgi:hypothetical protein
LASKSDDEDLLDIDIPDEEEDEQAIIAKRRKEREKLMQVNVSAKKS